VTYRIQRVDGRDDDTASSLRWLDKTTFRRTAPPIDTDQGVWWLVFSDMTCGPYPVGYGGLKWSHTEIDGIYLCRSGVLEEHRGNGLQVRLLRARETWARKTLATVMVTDTTGNFASANSLIKAGYRLYQPEEPWAFPNSLYWKKKL
jgi:GNAT superfamily N-acetyltransferase